MLRRVMQWKGTDPCSGNDYYGIQILGHFRRHVCNYYLCKHHTLISEPDYSEMSGAAWALLISSCRSSLSQIAL